MTGYKNRSVPEIRRPTERKRAQREKSISSRLKHCLYHSELKPMRYPAKTAHSGMIYYFWLLKDLAYIILFFICSFYICDFSIISLPAIVAYFLGLVCANALPATDFDVLLNRPSRRTLLAFEATGLDVCLLFLAMKLTSLSLYFIFLF